MNPIRQESIDDPRNWLFCQPAGLGILWDPRTGFMGIFVEADQQWTIQGPHRSFDHAVVWLREAAPELPLDDEAVEIWRARIEQPDGGAWH